MATADLIFVLAGRQERKEFGLRLYQQGHAPRLLVSVARYELRRFAKLNLPARVDLVAFAANVPPPKRHFFVFFHANLAEVERIPLGFLGTFHEIKGLANWLRGNPGIESLSIVSGRNHLRRVRLCCRELLPSTLQFEFVAVPRAAAATEPGVERGDFQMGGELLEFVKLCCYRVAFWLRIPGAGAGLS